MNETFDIAVFEQSVRERAYYLWEAEGRPAGRHVEHWILCEEALRAERRAAAPVEVVTARDADTAPPEAVAAPEAVVAAPQPAKPKKAAAKSKAAPRAKKPALVAKRSASTQPFSATLQ